jgi:hypothetical protein
VKVVNKNTRLRVKVLYNIVFTFLDSRREDKTFWTEL